MRNAPDQTVEYSDIFALTDEIEHQVVKLHEGLGIYPPQFIGDKQQIIEKAKLFWDTYFAGVPLMKTRYGGEITRGPRG